jgi:hypothetical protein
MKEFFFGQLVPYLDTAIVGALVLIIKEVGKNVTAYLVKKRELAEAQIKDAGKEEVVKTAWESFYEIDEKFRITDSIATALGSKADEFDKLMLKKIPGLTQDELTSLRQAIAGEVNQGKSSVIDQSSIIKQLQAEAATMQATIATLTSKAEDLEGKLSSIPDNVQAAFTTPKVEATDTQSILANTTENSTAAQ